MALYIITDAYSYLSVWSIVHTGNVLAWSTGRGRTVRLPVGVVGSTGRSRAMGGVCGRSNDVVWRKNRFRMHKVATTDNYTVLPKIGPRKFGNPGNTDNPKHPNPQATPM